MCSVVQENAVQTEDANRVTRGAMMWQLTSMLYPLQL